MEIVSKDEMTPLFPTAIGDEEDNLVIKSEIISFEQSIDTVIFVDTNIRCDDSSVSSNRDVVMRRIYFQSGRWFLQK